MRAPGKGLIKVSSILLFIVALVSAVVLLTGDLIANASAATRGIGRFSAVTSVVVQALPIAAALAAGLAGLLLSGRPKAGAALVVLGLAALVAAAVPFLVSLVREGFAWNRNWYHVASFVPPLLYLAGALLNQAAANRPEPEPEFDN